VEVSKECFGGFLEQQVIHVCLPFKDKVDKWGETIIAQEVLERVNSKWGTLCLGKVGVTIFKESVV